MHFAAISRLRDLQPGLPIPKRAIIMEIPALLGSSSSLTQYSWINLRIAASRVLLNCLIKSVLRAEIGGEKRRRSAIEPALQVHLPYQAGAGVWIIRWATLARLEIATIPYCRRPSILEFLWPEQMMQPQLNCCFSVCIRQFFDLAQS